MAATAWAEADTVAPALTQQTQSERSSRATLVRLLDELLGKSALVQAAATWTAKRARVTLAAAMVGAPEVPTQQAQQEQQVPTAVYLQPRALRLFVAVARAIADWASAAGVATALERGRAQEKAQEAAVAAAQYQWAIRVVVVAGWPHEEVRAEKPELDWLRSHAAAARSKAESRWV